MEEKSTTQPSLNDASATHVVMKPNKKPPTGIELFKQDLVGDFQKHVTNYFSGDKDKSMKFMTSVVRSVQKVPGLLECDKGSLLTAFMSAAELQLYPSSVSGEAYVLPYKGKAQFQLGYQGIITLFYRAGVDSIRTSIVFANDHFDYEEGLEPRLVHKPDAFSKDRGEPVGVYAIAVVNGQKLFKVMSKDEVMKFREFSQGKESKFSPWDPNNDPERHMWRKTAIKQLAKLLPKNETINKAIEKDNQDSVIEARRNSLDAGGPAVGSALHEPVAPQKDGE